MKFLSDILAKAGLTVDGVVTLNNTATGQTPNANDNSTKLATTAWVRTFVQPYSLPIATASILGGIKVGEGLSINATTGVLSTVGGASITSFRSEYIITATAGQTTFTVPNGYTPGKIDLFLNGVYLNDTIYTATNSSTIVLDDAAALDDILTVFVYSTYYVGDSPSARTTTYFTATSNQTVFTVAYVIGQVDIFYNGSKLEPSEYTANNGTSITLLTPATTGDKIEVVNWAVGGGIASTRTITINGVTYDLSANRSWSALPVGGTAGQLLAKVDGTDYNAQWVNEAPAASYTSQLKHRVKAGVAINKGQAVYVSSADGTNMIVSKASNATEATSSKTIGLLESTVSTNGTANVITEGLLAGLDTTGANAAGDPVWLGTDGNLIYGLANKPYAPAHLVFIGVVTRRNANNGEIFVKVQNGFEFNELHDLSVASPSDGDMIKYVASTGLWTKIAATTTNIAEGTNLYYTNTRSRTAISLTTSGTSGAATYDNTTGVINIPQYQGGVTSFNTRTGAITLSSSDVTTALTYTPVTNARTLTINGTTYDLSADRSWSIASGVTSFNTRTGAISLTSLDVTDALTYTPVTNARTLTINGTSYDLSANRSWTIAPDTSVRNTYAFTATAAQTTFTVSGGYTVGLVDVFINGVKLAAADFTATNGTTVVLGTGTGVGNIVEIIKYVSAFTTAVETTRTLTINGTTYDLSANRTWSIDNASLGAQPQLNGTGLVRMSGTTVSYDNATYATQSYVTTAVANLVNSAPSTLDTLNELAAALGNDANFATTVTTSIGTKQAQLNGTGFVKISGTTISYDNSTYLTTASASSTYLPLAGGTLTGALTGTSAIFNHNDAPTINIKRNGGTDSNTVIQFTNATRSFFIGSDGNVMGLGGTNGSIPSQPLQITSTGAVIFSSNIAVGAGTQAVSTDAELTLREGVAFVGLDFKSARTSGNIGGLRFYNTSSDSVPVSQILVETDGKLVFYNGTSAQEQRLTIASTGVVTFTNDVTLGVGAAATNVQLKLNGYVNKAGRIIFQESGVDKWLVGNGAASENGNFEIYNANGQMALSFVKATSAATFSNSVTAENGIYVRSGNGVYVNNASNTRTGYLITSSEGTELSSFNGAGEPLILKAPDASASIRLYTGGLTSANERVRITSTGNFGINTITPFDKLDVNGSIRFRANTPDFTAALDNAVLDYVPTSIFPTEPCIRLAAIGTSTVGAQIRFLTGTSTTLSEKMRITAGGDVFLVNNAALFFGFSALTYVAGGSNSMALAVNGGTAISINSLRQVRINTFIPGYDGSSATLQVAGFMRMSGALILHQATGDVNNQVAISCNGSNSFFVEGALSKSSGSFRIDHPLESMTDTHQLVHSFIEAPQADLYYRGKLTLVNGKAQANIDQVSNMTEGTFEALCREVQCFTTNETGWDLTKGKVIGNIIYIESQNQDSTDEISWLVIGERKDKHMIDTSWTDNNGKVIVEPLKQSKNIQF
jgi:hypothetical protein